MMRVFIPNYILIVVMVCIVQSIRADVVWVRIGSADLPVDGPAGLPLTINDLSGSVAAAVPDDQGALTVDLSGMDQVAPGFMVGVAHIAGDSHRVLRLKIGMPAHHRVADAGTFVPFADDFAPLFDREAHTIVVDALRWDEPVAELTDLPPLFSAEDTVLAQVSGLDIVAYASRLDGGAWSAPMPADTALTLADLNDGPHFLEVIGQDVTGVWQPQEQATAYIWTVDTVSPPAPVVSAPVLSGSATPTWTWTSSGGSATYRVQLDGTEAGGWQQTETASFTPTSSLADGLHRLYVQESYEVGGWSLPGVAEVTVDTIPPEILGLADETLPRLSKTWNWSATEPVTGYRYQIDTVADAVPAGEFGPVAVASIEDGDGRFYLHVQARDLAGNDGPVKTVSVDLDQNAPSMTAEWVGPAAILIRFGESVIGADAMENYGITPAVAVVGVDALAGDEWVVKTAPQQPQTAYTVCAAGVSDIAGNPAGCATVESGEFFFFDSDGIPLAFGESAGAGMGFDSYLDMPASDPDAVYLRNPQADAEVVQQLWVDLRPVSSITRWRLVLSGGERVVSLGWNASCVDADRQLWLARMVDETVEGTPVVLEGVGGAEVPAPGVFQVVYAAPETAQLRVVPGWNLLGSGLLTQSTMGWAGEGVWRGAAFIWRQRRFQVLGPNEPVPAERGVWVYADAAGLSERFSGVPCDGQILLRPGWNLAAPVTAVMPPPEVDAAWHWDPRSARYVGLAEKGAVLEPDLGWWLHLSGEAPVHWQTGGENR